MSNTLLSRCVNTAAPSMRLPVAASAPRHPPSLEGDPAMTVAALRAARKERFVRLGDPARRVVTDFAEEQACTIAEDRRIDDASIAMFRRGVHLLLVLREDGSIRGLLGSENLEAPSIAKFLEGHPECAPEDIRVRDLSTPCEELPAIDWDKIRSMSIRDLIQIVEAVDCGYLLVLEAPDRACPVLRGLISRARLLRRVEPLI